MDFLCFFLSSFLFCFVVESVHEYYGDRRQAQREGWRLFDPQAGECSSHSIWAQTAVMRFMELFTHSVFFSFHHIVMFIFLFKSKILFFRATRGPMRKILDALFRIVSEQKENTKESKHLTLNKRLLKKKTNSSNLPRHCFQLLLSLCY